MLPGFLRKLGKVIACAPAFMIMASSVQAQQYQAGSPSQTQQCQAASKNGTPIQGVGEPAVSDPELRARIEHLERQNEELLRAFQAMQTPKPGGTIQAVSHTNQNTNSGPGADGTTLNADSQNQQDSSVKQGNEWYRIGSNMKVEASFKDGLFLWLETPNKDFTMHIGGWLQWDNVWWTQSSDLRQAADGRPGHKQGVASGVAEGGIGDLEDGTFFRRIRLSFEGTFYEQGEYRLIPAFENDQFDTVGLDEFWVGMKDLPWIDTARVGHIKNAQGLEGDTTSSSRCMTFMERSAYSESILLNQNFVTGVLLTRNYLDQRMCSWLEAFRADQGSVTGSYFGDGQYGLQGRITGLPIYENDGRDLLHLGISGGWRNGSNNLANSSYRTFQLRARPELRDDDPAGSPSGNPAIPDSDSTRFIDTGVIAAENDFLMGLELLYIRGPFSVQVEYGWNFLDHALGVAPTGFTFNPAIVPAQDYVFSGGYFQLAYTLTGENRNYDRRLGTLARDYYGTTGPYTNTWFTRDENGCLNWGLGAWEIACRYSYVDLNDGSGLNRIQGGKMNGVSVALNWYLNRNANVMFDWVYNQRSNVPLGSVEGYVSGFGIEVQFQF
jgi:phosphate-selective porin OprO and OprP